MLQYKVKILKVFSRSDSLVKILMSVKYLHKALNFINLAIFPHKCIFCNSIIQESDICINCFVNLEFYTKHSCSTCALPIDSYLKKLTDKCIKCSQTSPYFDKIYTAFYYNEILSENIHKFKFYDKILYAKTYAKLISANIDSEYDFIIPVPLHYTKLVSRKYNQANEIAKELSKILYIPVINNNLIKIKNTKPQKNLKFSDRITNISEAFKLKNPSQINGKRILLVDDVVTTGATINECSKILKQAGACYVGVATCARTPKSN